MRQTEFKAHFSDAHGGEYAEVKFSLLGRKRIDAHTILKEAWKQFFLQHPDVEWCPHLEDFERWEIPSNFRYL